MFYHFTAAAIELFSTVSYLEQYMTWDCHRWFNLGAFNKKTNLSANNCSSEENSTGEPIAGLVGIDFVLDEIDGVRVVSQLQ